MSVFYNDFLMLHAYFKFASDDLIFGDLDIQKTWKLKFRLFSPGEFKMVLHHYGRLASHIFT